MQKKHEQNMYDYNEFLHLMVADYEDDGYRHDDLNFLLYSVSKISDNNTESHMDISGFENKHDIIVANNNSDIINYIKEFTLKMVSHNVYSIINRIKIRMNDIYTSIISLYT